MISSTREAAAASRATSCSEILLQRILVLLQCTLVLQALKHGCALLAARPCPLRMH
jgi:hypothetical protein